MRLTTKKTIDILRDVLGAEALPFINQFIGKENISEFDLAGKTKTDIKIIRKLLYILYNNNLVRFTRKKDKQKGWYIYYWTLLPESIKYIYFKKKKDLLHRLKERLEEEQKELFFTCPTACTRLNFDQAMEFEFHCPECGELVMQDNSEEKKAKLRQEIASLDEELGASAGRPMSPRPKKKVNKPKQAGKTSAKQKAKKKRR